METAISLTVNGAQRDLRVDPSRPLLEVLREGITAQLNHDLRPIIATAVAIAVDQVTEQTRKLLLEELNDALEARLRQLIEEEVTREMKKHRS